MLYYAIKLVVSAALIVAVSEVAKRSSLLGGLIASLPLVSYLGMIWLYVDTRDAARVAALAADIFWLVLPSLALFAALPWLLHRLSFPAALGAGTVMMFAAYGVMLWLLLGAGHVGIGVLKFMPGPAVPPIEEGMRSRMGVPVLSADELSAWWMT